MLRVRGSIQNTSWSRSRVARQPWSSAGPACSCSRTRVHRIYPYRGGAVVPGSSTVYMYFAPNTEHSRRYNDLKRHQFIPRGLLTDQNGRDNRERAKRDRKHAFVNNPQTINPANPELRVQDGKPINVRPDGTRPRSMVSKCLIPDPLLVPRAHSLPHRRDTTVPWS